MSKPRLTHSAESFLSPLKVLAQARVDLRKMAKSINLTKIEFLFSSTTNSFEGRCVFEAFGNVSHNSLFSVAAAKKQRGSSSRFLEGFLREAQKCMLSSQTAAEQVEQCSFSKS